MRYFVMILGSIAFSFLMADIFHLQRGSILGIICSVICLLLYIDMVIGNAVDRISKKSQNHG